MWFVPPYPDPDPDAPREVSRKFVVEYDDGTVRETDHAPLTEFWIGWVFGAVLSGAAMLALGGWLWN